MAEEPQLQRVPSVMEDPSARAVARVYAEAYLNSAGDQAEEALEEITSFQQDVLDAQPEFRRLLAGSMLGHDDRLGMIERVVAPRASARFTNFLRVLVRHDRLNLLGLIVQEARRMHETRTGRKRVQVTTAVPLSEGLASAVAERLRAVFPFEPIIEPVVDPSLLGGITIRVENTVYDSSLRTRLRQLVGRLRTRSLHEIQSGRDRFSHPEGN